MQKKNILIATSDKNIAKTIKELAISAELNVKSICQNYSEIENSIQNKIPHLAIIDFKMVNNLFFQNLLQKFNFPVTFINKIPQNKISCGFFETFEEMNLEDIFNTALEKFNIHKFENFITFKHHSENIKLNLNKISYIKSDNNYVEIFTKTKIYATRISLNSLNSMLNPELFIKVHRSYVVNKTYISSFLNHKLFINEISIPISRTYTNVVKAIFNKK